MLDLSLFLKAFCLSSFHERTFKMIYNKELASRMLFVCFILIFTTSHDIDTTDILCKFQNYGFGH